MSSDVKIPDWAMAEAKGLQIRIHARQSTMRLSRHADIEQDSIALALLAAEQRGRKAGLEEAAKVAETFVIIVYAHWDVTAITPLEQKSADGPLIAAAIRSLGEQR